MELLHLLLVLVQLFDAGVVQLLLDALLLATSSYSVNRLLELSDALVDGRCSGLCNLWLVGEQLGKLFHPRVDARDLCVCLSFLLGGRVVVFNDGVLLIKVCWRCVQELHELTALLKRNLLAGDQLQALSLCLFFLTNCGITGFAVSLCLFFSGQTHLLLLGYYAFFTTDLTLDVL